MKYVINEMARRRGYKQKQNRVWFGVMWLALLVCIVLYITMYLD